MEKFDIRRFNEYRENNRLEVKKAKGGLPNSLWETYSSMANSYGGVIVLGAEENSDGSFYTTGLKDDAKLKKNFWDTINNRSKVNINLLTDASVETYDLNGDVIMVIHVPRAKREQRPVYINNDMWNGSYRRNWEGDYHCTPSEIRSMLRDEPEEAMDMQVLEDFSIADLNEETIQSYRNYHTTVKPGHVWGKLSIEEYLEKIGAAGRIKNDDELRPTAAGLLMFGEEYRIVRHFPEYFLDYREELDSTIRWIDRIQSSSGDWTGNLFDFFFRVYNKLTRDIEKPFALDGITRIEDTPVHRAIREALANCIVNADFYLPEGIVIIKKRDKIVFKNPGSIRTGKTQMLRGGISDPRNKSIMKMLNLISIGERAGSGVPDIYSIWSQKGWENPIVEEQFGPDRTTLMLSFVLKTDKKDANRNADKANHDANDANYEANHEANDANQNAKTNTIEDLILDYIYENPRITQKEIAARAGISRATVQRTMKSMINKNIVVRIGATRGYWKIEKQI